jgi:uncharacterized protein YdcH (DUF465 family)
MDKQSIGHHIQHLEENHKRLEDDLVKAEVEYNRVLVTKLKKEKLKLKDEIEKFKVKLKTL